MPLSWSARHRTHADVKEVATKKWTSVSVTAFVAYLAVFILNVTLRNLGVLSLPVSDVITAAVIIASIATGVYVSARHRGSNETRRNE